MRWLPVQLGYDGEEVIEEDVPEHPLPHVIDRYVGFDCIRQTPKRCYSDAGRPSIGRRASASCHADRVFAYCNQRTQVDW